MNIANGSNQLGLYPQAIEAGNRALQMAPKRQISYSVLVRAYTRSGRFAEARAVAALAAQRNLDSSGLHGSLYWIAAAENNRDALVREAQWAAANNSGWYAWYYPDRLAEVAAGAGKHREAEDFFRRSWEAAIHENSPESAEAVLIDQAFDEFTFGLPAEARVTLSRVHSLDPDLADPAELRALMGDTAAAEHYINAHPASGAGTLMANLYLPRVRAALALARNKPLDAVAALEPAAPYELVNYYVIDERAQAYLKAGKPELAIPEYHKILSYPCLDPHLLNPLAHLGLARAYAMQKDNTVSRHEYEVFFGLWKDADADLPVLRQARREYAQLH